MAQNKKLRLLVTKDCHNNCPKCCNKQYDLDAVPIIDRFDYDEVSITGGEPMLDPYKVSIIAAMFKNIAKVQGKKIKVYLYTAKICFPDLYMMAKSHLMDGVCITPHSSRDIANFKALNRILVNAPHDNRTISANLSLRLNLFADVKEQLRGELLHLWKIKDMEWLDDYPIPEGEDFRRIAEI